MRYEAADLPEEKKQVIEEIVEEWNVDVRILDGWRFDGVLEFVEGYLIGFLESYPFVSPLSQRVYVQRSFLEMVPAKGLEFVLLHETGHVVDSRMGSEEFAERFALKHFSGEYEDYTEIWAYTMYHRKTGESLSDVKIGGDLV